MNLRVEDQAHGIRQSNIGSTTDVQKFRLYVEIQQQLVVQMYNKINIYFSYLRYNLQGRKACIFSKTIFFLLFACLFQVYGPAVKTKEALSIVNQLEPSFTLLRRQFTDQSHFYVFAKNPVGLSPGVQISTSLIVGLKQGSSCKIFQNIHFYSTAKNFEI